MYRAFKFRGYLRDPRFESRIYKISNGFLKTLYPTVSFIAGLNLNWLGSVRQATDGWIIKMDRPRLLPPFSPQEEPSEEEKLGGKKTLCASQCQAKLPAGKNALGPGVEPQG